MGSNLYDPNDPQAQQRDLQDKRFAVDHFKTKIFTLADGFKTPTGRRLAQIRHARAQRFLAEFMEEIGAMS
jgi:uncharacterized protein